MRFRQVGLSVVGAVVLISLVLMTATVWLLLTSPVTVANAINDGEIQPFIQDLARVLYNALMGLLRYL